MRRVTRAARAAVILAALSLYAAPGDAYTCPGGAVKCGAYGDDTHINGFVVDSNESLVFQSGTGATERLRITATGSLGLGTTTPKSSVDLSAKTDGLILQTASAAAGASCTGYTGGIRYNSAAAVNNIEYCDGTNWRFLAASTTACGSPSGLSFTNVTGASLSTVYSSNTATITFSGCSGGGLSVSVTGAATAQISINGGSWGTSGAITSGQTLQVRLTSSGSGSTMLTATVTVASTSTNWTVTTGALDPCTGTASSPTIGQVCTDGSVYAGVSPDGNVAMYAAPCDYGMTGSAGSCTGTRGGLKWSAGISVNVGVANQSTGKANTLALHNDDSNADTPYSAADYCYNLSGYLGHSDWYLPALGELNIMYQNATAIGGFSISTNPYWSSDDASDAGHALYETFSAGGQTLFNKATGYYVRCARHN